MPSHYPKRKKKKGYWRHKHTPYTVGGGVGVAAARFFGGKKGFLKRALKWGVGGALGWRGVQQVHSGVARSKIGRKAPGLAEAATVGSIVAPGIAPAAGAYGVYKDIKGYRRYRRLKKLHRMQVQRRRLR